MRRIGSAIAMVVCLSLAVLASPAPPSAAEEVIALTKAMWAADMKKDINGATKNIADDYTEFNDEYPTRLDGKQISWKLSEAAYGGAGSVVAAEMANEKVQMYGDVAILTYNYIGVSRDKDGKNEPVRAKSTRVYVKKNGQWWLVHANFAPAR